MDIAAYRRDSELRRTTLAANAVAAESEAYDSELNEARDVLFIETLLHETGGSLDGAWLDDAPGAVAEEASGGGEAFASSAFLEVGAEGQSVVELEKVHGYCEICSRMVQMYQRALPDICSGLTDTYFITCVKNMESVLKADRAVVYWHQIGCVHLDDGPEIVKPCPAHVICGWVPNIFARRVGITQSIGQLAPLCPRDINYLPRVPRTLAPGGLPS